MEIKLPNLQQQQRMVDIKTDIEDAAASMMSVLMSTPDFPAQSEVDESQYSAAHLLPEADGWEPPHPDIVGAYFRQFQSIFTDYGSDAKLARLLGLSSDRRIREYKQGVSKVPYGVWRKFLVMTGRAAQEAIPVFGFFGATDKMPAKYSYLVKQRTAGKKVLGFNLSLMKFGVHVGGGFYPVDKDDEVSLSEVSAQARDDAEAWLNSRR